MKSRRSLDRKKEPESIYCRRCMRQRAPYTFYTATDDLLDCNGKMSVCRDCINDLYDIFYEDERDVARVILRLCRILNIKFDPDAIDALQKQISTYEEKGKDVHAIFGIYKAKLGAVTSTKIGDELSEPDFTFYEPPSEVVENVHTIDEGKNLEYLEKMWGKGLSMSEYEYLENELTEWKRTTKCDTHPEEVLLKQICYVENDIRKKRMANQSVSGDLKTLREMMKSGALTPAQQSEHRTGKGADTYGAWIKDIETMTPAEFHDQQDKYRDMDGIQEDVDDIIRSIKNFMTDSRDFNSSQLEELAELTSELDDHVIIPEDVEEE